MFPVDLRSYCLLFTVLALLAGGLAARALAAQAAPPWQTEAHSRLRLISASDIAYQGRTVIVAGIEMVLDQGWKTYWRTPGDGLPPSIVWSGSENLKKAELLWPAPKRLDLPGGVLSFGYKKRVMLPILITPENKTQPVQLKMQISYGVCADICIPVETEISMTIPSSEHAQHRKLLTAALDRVPRPQQRGVYCPHSFITAKNRVINGAPALLIKTAFEDKATGLDLFAEAPDGFELPAAVRQPRASRGRLYYIIGFENAKALNALKGQQLTLTMVADQGSCETTWRMK